MIPDFGVDGNLPSGLHIATLNEFERRFSTNIVRKKLFGNLIRFITDVKSIGCTVVYIDGSYTTNKRLPNDIDLCWDNRGIDEVYAVSAMPVLLDRNLQKLLYNADIFPAYAIERASGVLFIDFFQRDKATGNPKGIVQINI